MKLLKLKTVSGYKMLEKNFEINFLTKTRIDKSVLNKELIELEDDFFYPIETILIGKNSSGKTTTLEFIYLILRFILTGRIPASFFSEQDFFETEFVFYNKGKIYKYNGLFYKDESVTKDFLIIKNESLLVGTYNKSSKKDLSNISYRVNSLIKSNVGGDTSDISKLEFGDSSILVNKIAENSTSFASLISNINKIYKSDVFSSIVSLFDNSIESIKLLINDNMPIGFLFKRINRDEILVSYDYLKSVLSSGTLRGIYIFAASIIAFNNGGHIMIDEIEKSFNKNLIENLILLFRDKKVNKKNASLIYSTHYSELLDDSPRCDNINVLHRDKDVISIKNMCESYKIRNDLSKSNQFEQNAFDNMLNYDQLISLRRILVKWK